MATLKTYKDSFLYNNRNAKEVNKTLSDYIMNSTRIDKTSTGFVGIIEDIKRQQTSTIIYKILLMKRVVLCINSYELPRAYKVLEAYDIKEDKAPTIFIDCTGIIELKNGYYVCKKTDVLITYLLDALVYLLYRYAPTRLMNNSEITISATKCYVSLFTYILDYLRIIGYAENKSKISYLIALFFIHNVMDKPLDNYAKNLAAKIAGVELNNINAYDLYIEDDTFDNIDIFVKTLADTFKLKGFTLEVLVSKWIRLIGTGTQYALELFTNFGMLLASAYAGSYIVNQNQIERACGTNLVKFNNALKQVGQQTFYSTFKEQEFIDSIKVRSNDYMVEAVTMMKESAPLVTSFDNIIEAVEAVEALKKFYNITKQNNKVYNAAFKNIENCVKVLESYFNDGTAPYAEGCLCAICAKSKNILGQDEINKIMRLLKDKLAFCRESAEKEMDQSTMNRKARCVTEIMQSINEL